MKEQKKEEHLNPVSEVIQHIDLVSNSTDKRRKELIERLKNVIRDLRSARKKQNAKLAHQ